MTWCLFIAGFLIAAGVKVKDGNSADIAAAALVYMLAAAMMCLAALLNFGVVRP